MNTMPCSATVLELLTDAGTKPYPSFDALVRQDWEEQQKSTHQQAIELRQLAGGEGAAAKIVFRDFMDVVINDDAFDTVLRAAINGDRDELLAEFEKLIADVAERLVEAA